MAPAKSSVKVLVSAEQASAPEAVLMNDPLSIDPLSELSGAEVGLGATPVP